MEKSHPDPSTEPVPLDRAPLLAGRVDEQHWLQAYGQVPNPDIQRLIPPQKGSWSHLGNRVVLAPHHLVAPGHPHGD
jgi:hypothetical protein